MTAIKERTSFRQNVSAEPAVFLYSFVVFLYNAVIPNLIQQKVCSPSSPPAVEFACNDTVLLAEATDIVTIRSTLRSALPAVILLLAGSWRDATCLNKPIMYFSLIWEIVGISIEIFSYLNWTVSPWKTVIAEGIINGSGGGSTLFYVGAYCAIADSCKTEDRTARFTLVTAAISFAACLAFGVSGYCLTFMGYTWFLIFTISLQLATFALVMFFVKDEKPKEVVKGYITEMLKQLRSAIKRRPNNTIIWFMVLSSSSITVMSIAEGNLYQYFLQKGFDYTIEETGVYISYRLMIASVGSVLIPPILIKFLKWSDFKIGVVSSAVTIISCIAMVFANTNLELNLFALLDFMKAFLYGLPKSVISKCLHDDEIGVFVSFCSIGECILPIGMFYLYDYIYSATSTELPGAFYLASAATVIVSLIFYSISSCIYTPLDSYGIEDQNISNDPEKCENNPSSTKV